jgi:hypothetical protein
MEGIGPQLFCPPPEGISADQAIRIIRKHLDSNPENLHKPARTEAVIAMAKAFPCER